MGEPGFVERLRSAASIVDAAFADLRDEFHTASSSDRAKMLDVLSEFELKHQSHLAQFARAVDTAPSVLSSAAKDLHYRSTAELVQCELGHGKFVADTITRLGKLLEQREYPALANAIDDGVVSNQQAGVIVRKLDEWRPTRSDDELMAADAAAVEWACGAGNNPPLKPEQLQKMLRTWDKQQHPENAEAVAAQQWEQRKCSAFVRDDGMIHLFALLTPAEGAAILQYLEANSAPRVRFHDVDDLPEHDDRRREQKTADALVRAICVAAKTKDSSVQGGAAPTLTVLAELEELQKYAAGQPGIATVSRTGEIIPVAEAALIACHGAIQAAAIDKHGHILKLGRSTRLFNATQRKALNIEYPECATSGCDIPAAWCESHHITWWSRGGGTDTENGVNLCNYHHHQVHMGHFELQQDTQTHRWKAIRNIRR